MTNGMGTPQLTDGGSDSVMTAILDIVADREGVDVGELPPLYDAVDPDALESLFAPTRTGSPRTGRVEFTYAGYVVALVSDRDGSIVVSLGERNAAYRWFQDTTSARADAKVHLD